MILRTKQAILPALAGMVLLANLGISPAVAAEDTFTISVATADAGQECMDTSAQKKVNESIDSKRIVMPFDKGTYAKTSPYGMRISPITGAPEMHTGSDFAAPDRSPIYSVAPGTVMASGPTSYLGEWVIVRHNIDGKTYDSVYGHLTSMSQVVKAGDKVEAGQHIADEGSTGMSTGPHLHLELWENGFQTEKGKTIDPLKWLENKGATHREETPTYKSLECSFNAITKTPNASWGGFKNGEIPADKLKAISFNSAVHLETQTANELEAFNAEFKKKFGVDMPLIKGYQDVASQSKNEPETVAGKSFFGWGKSVEFKFTGASNSYMPLVSEPDYFTDEQYVWMMENGKNFGWANPEKNQKGGEAPNPGLWVYSEQIKNTQSKDSLRTYAVVEAMQFPWSNSKNKQCLTDLWSKDGDWNTMYNQDGEFGLAKLSQAEVESQKVSFEKYTKDANTQVATGVRYIADKYDDPCQALTTWTTTGKY